MILKPMVLTVCLGCCKLWWMMLSRFFALAGYKVERRLESVVQCGYLCYWFGTGVCRKIGWRMVSTAVRIISTDLLTRVTLQTREMALPGPESFTSGTDSSDGGESKMVMVMGKSCVFSTQYT